MTDDLTNVIPKTYSNILLKTEKAGFSIALDIKTCSLLRTLAATKPGGVFLELGKGTGLSTSWILDGMDDNSTLTSIDNDEKVLDIALKYTSLDKRLKLINIDGEKWLRENAIQKFKFIFADTWPGKYLLLEKTITILNQGGIYI